jgi:hypothetical protein
MGTSFLQGYYSIHDMTDGYLGLAPHSQSDKDFALEVEYRPDQVLPTFEELSFWTVVLVSILILVWIILLACVIHNTFINLGWELFSVLLVEFCITAGLLIFIFLWLVPALNDVFFNVPVVTEVDPHSLTIFRTVVTLGAAVGAIGFMKQRT